MSFGQEVKDFISAFSATSGAMARNSQLDLERQRFQAQNDYLMTRQNYLNSKINGANTNVPDPATAAGEAGRQQYKGSGAGIGDNNARAQQAFNYFAPIYGTAGAAGIVGNWMQESSFADDVISGKRLGDKSIPGGSFGIGQWNKERLTALRNFAAQKGTAPGDFQTQLEFAQHELSTSEASVGNALKAAKDPSQAAQIFLGFERPQGYTEYVKSGARNPAMINGWGNRVSYAQSAFQKFAGGAPTQTAQGSGTPDAAAPQPPIPQPPQTAQSQGQGGGDDQFDKNGKAVPLTFAPVVQADTSPAGLDTTVAPPTPPIPQPPQYAQTGDQPGYEDDQ